MNSREEVFQTLRDLLVKMFEIEPGSIHPDSNLYEDLDVDSIDAVDLIVELRSITGKSIEPDVFKEVRTVDDVVDAVLAIIET